MRKALALAAVFGALAWLEHRRPLRARTQPRGRRVAINLALSGIAALGAGAIMELVVRRATAAVERHRLGVTRWVPLPRWMARAAGTVLLDYSLWHWHRLCHRVPALWNVHAAHHADLDLDVSTGLRFHVVEMWLSIPFRAAQILVLGIDRPTLRSWETALLVAIMFHHSNVRLPERLDAALARVVITPRLHGIHHSALPLRFDANLGTLLSWWDMLHGSFESELAQADLAIGLPRTLGQRSPGVVESLLLPLSPGMTST